MLGDLLDTLLEHLLELLLFFDDLQLQHLVPMHQSQYFLVLPLQLLLFGMSVSSIIAQLLYLPLELLYPSQVVLLFLDGLLGQSIELIPKITVLLGLQHIPEQLYALQVTLVFGEHPDIIFNSRNP